ncbi:MAG: HAMP domain-containing histidine kinase [Lachnospiraceae bacterium]|nr:HAMP domain-containing histidine kinase [Lachnospiraceae bacterium]
MIKILRRRFILVTMISTFAVLSVIIGALNIASFTGINNRNDAVLAFLAGNDGRFPDEYMIPPEDKTFGFDSEKPELKKPEMPANDDFSRENRHFTREMPYETRFFSVNLDYDGRIITYDTGMIFAVDDEEVSEYAESAFYSFQRFKKVRGTNNAYRYLLKQTDSGYRIIFTDISRDIQNAKRVLLYSLIISIIGLAAVYVLVYFFSKKVFKPIEESYQKQKRFITDASHELKTPLAIIAANADVIEMEAGESEWSKSIKNQVGRMSSLVENMVELTRLDEGSNLLFEDMDLSTAIKETAETYNALSETKGLTINVNVESGIKVKGDEAKLRQMAGLLLDNAIKYSVKDESRRIEVSLKKKSGKAVLKISNPAEGLSIQNYDVLFDRFYRPDSSRNSKEGGSGIGLSVVKSIAEAHSYKASAYSKDAKIITFEIKDIK